MLIKENDNWLILGPGRTGSKVIIDVIRSIYRQYQWNIKYYNPTSDLNVIEKKGEIYHSHNLLDYDKFTNSGTKIIISIRDMVDSALSWCITDYTKSWHLYSHKNNPFEVKPVLLNLNRFEFHYNRIKTFYNNIKYNRNDYFIDYKIFQNNPLNIIKFLNIENSINCDSIYVPIKNPGEPKDWFLNWEEIKKEIEKFSREPTFKID